MKLLHLKKKKRKIVLPTGNRQRAREISWAATVNNPRANRIVIEDERPRRRNILRKDIHSVIEERSRQYLCILDDGQQEWIIKSKVPEEIVREYRDHLETEAENPDGFPIIPEEELGNFWKSNYVEE